MNVIRKKYDSTSKEGGRESKSEMRSKGTMLCRSPQCTGGAAGDSPVESKEERAGLMPAAWHHNFQVSHQADQL